MNDLATLVRDKAVERIASGELKPNIRDGIAAQALIDRREERQKDRSFMLALARLTSGSEEAPPASVIVLDPGDIPLALLATGDALDGSVIEGEAVVVQEDAE